MTTQPLVEEVSLWEELVDLRKEASGMIVSQLALITEVRKAYKTEIEADPDLEKTITGLMLSYHDVAKEVIAVSLEHATGTKEEFGLTIPTGYREGSVTMDDEDTYMEYLKIAGCYVTLMEKVGALTSTGFTDVFIKLRLDTTALQEAADTGQRDVAKALAGDL